MKVDLYVSDTCASCQKVKKFLEDKGITVVEKNVSEPNNAGFLEINDIYYVPVTVTEQGDIIVGADFKKLARIRR